MGTIDFIIQFSLGSLFTPSKAQFFFLFSICFIICGWDARISCQSVDIVHIIVAVTGKAHAKQRIGI